MTIGLHHPSSMIRGLNLDQFYKYLQSVNKPKVDQVCFQANDSVESKEVSNSAEPLIIETCEVCVLFFFYLFIYFFLVGEERSR